MAQTSDLECRDLKLIIRIYTLEQFIRPIDSGGWHKASAPVGGARRHPEDYPGWEVGAIFATMAA